MRCRLRYRAGWTAFLFIFSIAGVILTYRQVKENANEKKALALQFIVPENTKPVIEFHQDVHPAKRMQKEPEDDRVLLMEEDKTVKLRKLLSDLYPSNWGTAKDADEMAYEIKLELSDQGFDSELSCKEIDNLHVSQSVKVGSKKYVDRAFLRPQNIEVVIKSQGNDPDTKIKCMSNVYDADKCHVMGNYMLMREVLLLTILKHKGIIKLIGYCIRGDNINFDIKKKGLVIVQESGIPLNSNHLSYLSWKKRLMYAIQLSELLHYLENSPLGSVGLVGIKMEDFVITRKKLLKLVDLDDVELQEHTCRSDRDCKIPLASEAKVECQSGRCKNWNAKRNLQMVGTIFHQMLSNPPSAISQKVSHLKHSILLLDVSSEEILQRLKGIQAESKDTEEFASDTHQENHDQRDVDQSQGQGSVKVDLVQERVIPRVDDQLRQEEIQENRVLPDKVVVRRSYIRYNQANFPGLYDYTCSSSRVNWGCVITVHSLSEAKSICDNDPVCKSFVLFTSNPDGDALMTMVAKNSGEGKPQPNVGATLFIQGISSNELKEPKGQGHRKSTSAPTVSVADCRIRTMGVTLDARNSREKRLMAHLGLKGTSEEKWQLKVRMSHIRRHNHFDKLMVQSTIGGRFEVELANLENNIRKGIFLYEKGPSQYHIAHLLTYHLDRMLGLYHTPPTVTWQMRVSDVAKVQGDKVWGDTLGPLMTNGNDLNGLITAPVPATVAPDQVTLVNMTHMVGNVQSFNKTDKMQIEYIFLWYLAKSVHNSSNHLSHKGLLTSSIPHVIREGSLQVDRLKRMPHSVVPYNRMEKLQLEYVFLWYLTKSSISDDSHLGYKGHLIHFNADQAFQDVGVNLLGYFYNCQFPNVVYKALSCFKCTTHGSSICSLGQEVMQRILSEGYTNREIKINNLTPDELTTIINDGATSVLSVVDSCIKTFGREKVLY